MTPGETPIRATAFASHSVTICPSWTVCPACHATDAQQLCSVCHDCWGCHPRECLWIFDLNGIEEMYRSYETHSFWPFLSAPTQGICVNFVRAEHSSYHWSEADLDRLAAYGHCVHTLSDAGLLSTAASHAQPCALLSRDGCRMGSHFLSGICNAMLQLRVVCWCIY